MSTPLADRSVPQPAPAAVDPRPPAPGPGWFARLLTRLEWVRSYRTLRPSPFHWSVRLPFVRNAIRHAAHRTWPGGYVFVQDGTLLYVPQPVDVMAGSHLLKPYRPAPIIEVLCKPGDTVIDVGANLGNWTVTAARAVGREGRVIAVEAAPAIAAALKKTVDINRFRWVKVIPAACAAAEGKVTFSMERENSGGSRLGTMASDAARTFRSTEVPAVTLDGIARREQLSQVDVIKVDVEGSEALVLRGATDVLRRFKPALCLETGHEGDEDRKAIAELCAGLGYRIAGVVAGNGLMEGDWEDYLARQGAFSGGISDMVLLAEAA